MSNYSNVTVYVVQALSRATGNLELLGIFDTEARAQEFIGQAPMPQRKCLHIMPWQLNHHTEDEFWRTGYKPLAESEVLEALHKANEGDR